MMAFMLGFNVERGLSHELFYLMHTGLGCRQSRDRDFHFTDEETDSERLCALAQVPLVSSRSKSPLGPSALRTVVPAASLFSDTFPLPVHVLLILNL